MHKNKPCFPPISDVFISSILKNAAGPLNYSLGGLCRFPGGGYKYAALETLESMNNYTSFQDNRNFTEFGAPLHQVYIEGSSSRCVVEGSLLTTILPARSYIISNLFKSL